MDRTNNTSSQGEAFFCCITRSRITGGVIIFGVGIPEHESQAEELKSLRASFRRSNTLFIIICALALLPLFAINRYFSLNLYLLVGLDGYRNMGRISIVLEVSPGRGPD
ncbi:hypothetical protein [Paenibacillus durus]|uniref:hypothetical protein n=1 Tax=Paenibacillus durus TaxID=44251 RepID=UPI000A9689D8|nr:hypothetical protein [Paenibacillus durus]